MKRFNSFLVGLLVLSVSFFVFANDNNDKEHEFKAGVMKDIFDGIEGAGGVELLTESDLVGMWMCNAVASTDAWIPDRDNAWIPKGEGSEGGPLYYQYSGGILNCVDNGDGSFSITLPGQDPFYLVSTDETAISPCKVIGNTLYRVCYYQKYGRILENNILFSIRKINENRIVLKALGNNPYTAKVIICDRVITP